MNLYEKINSIMGEVKSLQKDGKIAFGNTKYNYLSEAKTTETLREQFVKHKIVMLPLLASESKDGQVTHGTYTYRLINAEEPGEYIDLMACGQGHDSADKGSGKASSYAYKYLLWRTFAIPSNDDPDQVSSDEIVKDKNKQKPTKSEPDFSEMAESQITKSQANVLKTLINQFGADEKKLCDYYKVASVEVMTNEQYSSALAELKKKYSKDK
jgi:hypothetical protein